MAKKYVKVGDVKVGEYGPYVSLGKTNPKSPNFDFTVEVVVKDSKGKVLANTTNGNLSVFDPRKRKGITEEQAARIPEYLKHELFIALEE